MKTKVNKSHWNVKFVSYEENIKRDSHIEKGNVTDDINSSLIKNLYDFSQV